MESLSKKVFSGTLYNYLGKFISLPLIFITSVYIVRMLNVDDYGVYGILLSFSAYFLLVSYLGMPNIIQRYLPEQIETHNYFMAKKIIIWGLIIPFIPATIFIILCLIFVDNLGQILNAPTLPNYFAIFAVYMVVVLEVGISNVTLDALLQQKYKNISRIIHAILNLIFVYAALKTGFGLLGLILALAFSNLILFLIFLVKIWHSVLLRSSFGRKINIGKRAARYGSYFYFTGLGELILDASTDIYLISYFLGTVAVGYYTFAYRQTNTLRLLMPTLILLQVLLPAVVRYYTRGKNEEFLSFVFSFSSKLTVFFVLPVTVWCVILSREIISYIFDPKYLPATQVFIAWLIIAGVKSLSKPLNLVLVTVEKVKIFLYAQIFLIYNILGDIILIPWFGIMGAAIATGSSVFFSYLLVLYYAKKNIPNLSYPWPSFFSITVNTTISGIIVFLTRGFISNIPSLLLIFFLGALVYLIAAAINKSFNKRENEIISRAIPVKILF